MIHTEQLTSASCLSRTMLQLLVESLCGPPDAPREELVSPVPTGPKRSPICKMLRTYINQQDV